MLRSLRHYLWAHRQGHHTIDRLEERGEGGGGEGSARRFVSQTNIGTVSKATLGKHLTDEAERMRAFRRVQIPS